ncbi:MAG TPA: hydrogenase maturation nickel metallochaperone HypA [Peptococcaceae bacterium]|nr:hydrogenase maturation nickel metallochaperone HypA [Peptococcaceae bacterium]
MLDFIKYKVDFDRRGGKMIMHELSLMESITKTLRASAAENGITKITRIRLVVGKLTMALPEALQYAFEVFKSEELFQDAVLEIAEEPVRGECQKCHHRFEINDGEFSCPACGSLRVKLVGGRELYIDFYEGD